MRYVYIDESGYTGTDLLNQEQPFQGASAVYISESEASDLISKHFPNLKSNELKYKSLARRPNNWDRLYNLQKDLLENFICISYICDKKFLLILHFLNYATEPFYHDRGVDFYKDGNNHSLASLLYYTANNFLGKENFTEVLSLFQHAMNSNSTISTFALVEKIKSIPWKEMPEAFGPLALETPSCIHEIMQKETSTDGAYVVLLSLISRLEVVLNTTYTIIHDESENLKQYDSSLNRMIHHKSEISFKETDLTTINFPLKLSNVSQTDSKKSFGVQLADILIGGIMDYSKTITGIKVNEYNKSIIDLYKENQLIYLLPSLDFDQQKKFRKNTQGKEVIDYFSKHFR